MRNRASAASECPDTDVLVPETQHLRHLNLLPPSEYDESAAEVCLEMATRH
jgi:hypothetical protein